MQHQYIRFLEEISRGDIEIAGGKAANLGAMVRAGLPVPPGFVVVTAAYRAFVADAGIGGEIDRIASKVDAADQASLDAASEGIRALFSASAIPVHIEREIVTAYESRGRGAVAVRSSATAEDLPDASFAGQQETYLNIEGAPNVVAAVRRCWSSLWTGRALAYRIRNRVASSDVALAVVVQQLVAADVAGVLFTADPVSGRRDRMVVDAAWGLGETVVSGAVSPDNWVVDGATGAVISERVGNKRVMTVRTPGGTTEHAVPPDLQSRAVLDAGQLASLAGIGRRTAEFFGSPQDIEWTLAGGKLSLVQSRPITTLFPVPTPATPPEEGFRILVTLQGMQGVLDPISPATIAMFRGVAAGIARKIGVSLPVRGPIALAAGRIYIDVTGLLKTKQGRRLIAGGTIDLAMGRAVQDLIAKGGDRMGPVVRARPPISRLPKRLILTLARRVLAGMISPGRARERARRRVEAFIAALTDRARSLRDSSDRLEFIGNFGGEMLAGVFARTVPLWFASLIANAIVTRNLRRWGIDVARLEPIGRSIPHNPTTEMDLELWHTSRALLRDGSAAPRAEHPKVRALLDKYGHRTVGEIDLRNPRWSEDPGHILHLLSTYMERSDGPDDPLHRFRSGAEVAQKAADGIVAEVRTRKGPIAAGITSLLIRRFRALSGLREWHKFYAVHVFAIVRGLLLATGRELVASGLLNEPGDIFFLDFRETRLDTDCRTTAAQSRGEFERNARIRSIPLAITNDGEISYGARAESDGSLAGLGASAGVFEGVARVVLDPAGARLAPGEVLVAPATDPAWTPLFLTAGALVTETGGMISHGSVVAREYGIPAVVGVRDATTRIATGARIRVDGSTGTVVIL